MVCFSSPAVSPCLRLKIPISFDIFFFSLRSDSIFVISSLLLPSILRNSASSKFTPRALVFSFTVSRLFLMKFISNMPELYHTGCYCAKSKAGGSFGNRHLESFDPVGDQLTNWDKDDRKSYLFIRILASSTNSSILFSSFNFCSIRLISFTNSGLPFLTAIAEPNNAS
jgi:hypothetical protein